jgi:hypothetical protein
MNDLKTLYEVWDAPAAPSHRAAGRARAALLARARRRRFRLGARLAVLGAAALALLAAVTLTENLGGTRADVPVASAAPVLERAAVAAVEKPFVAPRDDQWIYVKERFGGSVTEPVARQERWSRADGGGFAFVDVDGKLHVEIVPSPPRSCAGPTDGRRTRPAAGWTTTATSTSSSTTFWAATSCRPTSRQASSAR